MYYLAVNKQFGHTVLYESYQHQQVKFVQQLTRPKRLGHMHSVPGEEIPIDSNTTQLQVTIEFEYDKFKNPRILKYKKFKKTHTDIKQFGMLENAIAAACMDQL